MAEKDRQKLIHLHSASAKVPNAGQLAKGEIAVQYAANDPALYIEKADGAIAKFVDEDKIEELVSAGIAAANTSAYEYADDAAESALTAANNYADALVKDTEGNNLFDEAGAADAALSAATADTAAQIAALKLDETYAVKAVEGRVDALEAKTVNGKNITENPVLDGKDIKLTADYTKAEGVSAITTGDTVEVALGKLEKQIDNAVAGGLQAVEKGNGINVTSVVDNKQTISIDIKNGNNWLSVSDSGLTLDEETIKTMADDKIKALNATAGTQTVAEGKHFAVEVVETEGKVTAVNLAENDIASEAKLNELSGSVIANYATSAQTVAAIKVVDDKFADYATSADTVAAIEAVNTAATEALKAYATSADTVAAIKVVDDKFANYATSAQTVAAIKVVDDKFANYATSAQTVAAIKVVDDKLADYATSAQTVAAIEAVDGKFADYATSAQTVAAIEAAKDARVDTLVGEDANMSVRNIAADEASKAMANVVSGAPEAFDTLKEIADWIGDGAANTTAAQMVTDIADLKAISADTRIEALEALSGKSHTHDNKALLDTYTQTEANLADAVTKKHEHENADVLDGISAEDVDAWNGAVKIANGVNEAIATAKGEAISTATADTAAQIAALKLDETYAVKAVEGRVEALEALSVGSRLDAVEEVVGDLEENFDEAGAADAAFSAATANTAEQIEALSLGSAAQADVAEEDIVSGSTDDGLVSAAQVAKYVDDELAKVAEVADNALVRVVTADDTTSASISATTADNITTLDFSAMIIDCGEY